MQEYLAILLLSLMPFAELRGAIPLAYYLLGPHSPSRFIGIAIAVIGNLIVAPILIVVLRVAEDWLIKHESGILGPIANLYSRIVKYVRGKTQKYIKRWGLIGLAIYVGIPLPFTGAWTGSLAAHILGLTTDDRLNGRVTIKALLAIELGVIMAAAIVIAAFETGSAILTILTGGI
jgi:uncharacterized membrane protein